MPMFASHRFTDHRSPITILFWEECLRETPQRSTFDAVDDGLDAPSMASCGDVPTSHALNKSVATVGLAHHVLHHHLDVIARRRCRTARRRARRGVGSRALQTCTARFRPWNRWSIRPCWVDLGIKRRNSISILLRCVSTVFRP